MKNIIWKSKSSFLVLLLFLSFSPSLLLKAQFRANFSSHNAKIDCQTLHLLMRAFLQMHILPPKIDDAFYQEAAKQFANRLDPSKNLLLLKDAESVQQMATEFFKHYSKANCSGLSAIPEMLVRQSSEQLKIAKEILGKDYKFNENVKIITDTKKINRSKNREEMKKKLRNYIHFQISTYLLNSATLEEAKEKLLRRYKLQVKRMREFNIQKVYDLALNAFAVALDPHSMYLSKESLDEFKIAMSLSLEGIGAALTSEDGYTVIEKLIPGGAAKKSKKLKPKDKILFVGQGKDGPMEDIVDMRLQDVVKKIRGKKGTIVRLRILRQGKENTTFVINLVRTKVKLESFAAKLNFHEIKLRENKIKIAHVLLPSFYGDVHLKDRSSYEDLKKILQKVKKENAKGLVLDFSSNGGGRLEEAVRIAGLFIREGDIVTTKDIQSMLRLADTDKSIQYDGPMVILTNRVSASASEIVAGALKDYRRAVIVGDEYTYGKGSVQAIRPLMPSIPGAIKVTTGLFFIPSGSSTQHTGVSANVVLPSYYSNDKIGERHLDNSLKPQMIKPFFSKGVNFYKDKSETLAWKPISDRELKFLKNSSKDRVKNNPKFQEIKKEIQELKKDDDVIDLAKLRKKQVEEKSKEKKQGEEAEEEKNKIYVDEAIKVLVDLIAFRSGLIKESKIAKYLGD